MGLLRERANAGQQLAQHLNDYAGDENTIVLALPRGGVPVGYEIAHAPGQLMARASMEQLTWSIA